MPRITEEAEIELAEFKSKAKAIIDDDFNGLLESAFLDIDNYKDVNGETYQDYEDMVLEDYNEKLFNKSSYIKTAYEVDEEYNAINNKYSLTGLDNINKSYITISVLNGKHINGEIVLSNEGEIFIQAFDKGYLNGLYFEEGIEINDYHTLYSVANYIADGNFNEVEIDRGLEELSHYFNTVKDYEFNSSEDFNDFRTNLLREIENKEFEFPVKKYLVMQNLMSNINNFNSIIIRESDHESENPFIFEIDGNIFYHDTTGTGLHLEHELRFIEAGEEFIFRGAVGIAQPGELKVIEMQLYGQYEMDVNEIEDNAEPAPVKKKQSKFKP